MTLIGLAMQPLHLGGSVRVEQVLAFFDRVVPDYDRTTMRDAIDLLLRADMGPKVEAVLAKLRSALGDLRPNQPSSVLKTTSEM